MSQSNRKQLNLFDEFTWEQRRKLAACDSNPVHDEDEHMIGGKPISYWI